MGSVVIVVMDPLLVGLSAGFVGQVGLGVDLFLVAGAAEPLHFPVGLGPVEPGPLVCDVRV